MLAALALRAPVALAAGALALGALACAGPDAPWDVPAGYELNHERAVAECEMLTVDPRGEEGPISFDACMERRGWSRQGPLKRWWRELRAPAEDAPIDGSVAPR